MNENLNSICGYKLDDDQKEVVYNTTNNILVIAGAGSGKTLTIVGKIKYLLNIGYKSDQILCISFTNDAVNSLINKINKSFNKKIKIDVFTFHKLAINIFNHYNKKVNLVNEELLKYIINEFFLSNCDNNIRLLILAKKYYDLKYLKNIIFHFITIFKSKGLSIDDYFNFFKKNSKKINTFLAITLYIYVNYELEKKSQNLIDFDDLVFDATKLLKNKYKKYKYIIIDEFQDTSYIRLLLIKKLMKLNETKLMLVGDDYQSIYKFSGSDINIFLNSNKYINNLKIMYLENTYRFSNELAFISGDFISKNKFQFKKNLKSLKTNSKPIKIYYYKKENELYKLIDYINNEILILGRNNNDILPFYKPNKLGIINSKLRYLTVHKSKGLESNEVILINLSNNLLGFPSKIKDTKELSFITRKDTIKYEEERRLFYVALTRSKNSVYLFINKKNKSIFVKELKKNYKNFIEYLRFK